MPSFCTVEGRGCFGGELRPRWWLEGGSLPNFRFPKPGTRYFWPGHTPTASDACIVIAFGVYVVFFADWCKSNGEYGRSLGEASDLYSTTEDQSKVGIHLLVACLSGMTVENRMHSSSTRCVRSLLTCSCRVLWQYQPRLALDSPSLVIAVIHCVLRLSSRFGHRCDRFCCYLETAKSVCCGYHPG